MFNTVWAVHNELWCDSFHCSPLSNLNLDSIYITRNDKSSIGKSKVFLFHFMFKIRTESSTELLNYVVTETFVIPGSEWFKIVSHKLTKRMIQGKFINSILINFQFLKTVLLFNRANRSRRQAKRTEKVNVSLLKLIHATCTDTFMKRTREYAGSSRQWESPKSVG